MLPDARVCFRARYVGLVGSPFHCFCDIYDIVFEVDVFQLDGTGFSAPFAGAQIDNGRQCFGVPQGGFDDLDLVLLGRLAAAAGQPARQGCHFCGIVIPVPLRVVDIKLKNRVQHGFLIRYSGMRSVESGKKRLYFPWFDGLYPAASELPERAGYAGQIGFLRAVLHFQHLCPVTLGHVLKERAEFFQKLFFLPAFFAGDDILAAFSPCFDGVTAGKAFALPVYYFVAFPHAVCFLPQPLGRILWIGTIQAGKCFAGLHKKISFRVQER